MSNPTSTAIPTFRFRDGQWTAEVAVEQQSSDQHSQLRIATLNILADCWPWFVKAATPPEDRMQGLLQEIRRVDADVLALNEVTPKQLEALLEDPWVRAKYSTTDLPSTHIAPHSCVILVRPLASAAWRLPVLRETTWSVPKQKRVPVAVLVHGLVVCSLHTMAFQRGDTRGIRERQISDVRTSLSELGHPFVIAGDLNLHDGPEDAVVIDNDLLDCWAETHPRFTAGRDMATDEPDAGFTFDARRNGMIPRYIPGERRRMRLDRILAQRGLPWEPAAPCALWADEPVDASRDVWCSDHFGLVVTLRRSAGWNGDPSVRAALNENAQSAQGPCKVSKLRFTTALIGHTGWLAMRMAGMK